ncbi:hypothetical protein HWV62_28272 [Athelia sp. TMB]|nr:hypothetical protein HWV62_28272 [Athelia sp. TMB]
MDHSLSVKSAQADKDKGFETIEIDPQYTMGHGLMQGAVSVGMEPVSADDREIIELHAGHVEDTLLGQVRVSRVGQEINVWVLGHPLLIDPQSKPDALLLTTNTEVSIAPKLRSTTSPLPSKKATRSFPATTTSNTSSKEKPTRPESIALTSKATFDILTAPNNLFGEAEAKEVGEHFHHATLLHLASPLDPSAAAPGAAPAAMPTANVITAKDPSSAQPKSDDACQRERLGIGGTRIDDMTCAAGSPASANRRPKSYLPAPSLPPSASSKEKEPFLACVDDILTKCTDFVGRAFALHAGMQVRRGVSALLITGRSGAGKTSIANTVASRVQADSGLYIDLARYTETPVQTLKALFKYWWAVVAWHRPSVLVLDNVDKLMGVELEHADSFRTRHLTELFVALYSASARSAAPNTRGIVVIGTAQSQAALHSLLSSAHVFSEIVGILARIVESRLDLANDIKPDLASPLNFTALATQTEGYSATDLHDLVARAMHQAAMWSTKDESVDADAEVHFTYLTSSLISTLTMNVQTKLSGADFDAAQVDFVPLSLRDVKLQKSDVAWSDIGGKLEGNEEGFEGDAQMAHKVWTHLQAITFVLALRIRRFFVQVVLKVDQSLLCDMPDLEDRKDILKAVSGKVSITSDIDWSYIAETTEEFSGADLQALVYTAHLEVVHSSIAADPVLDLQASVEAEGEEVKYVALGGEKGRGAVSRAEESAIRRRVGFLLSLPASP